MIKLVYCVRRRADVAPEEFRRTWLEDHGPLVRSYASALKAVRYVQSHTMDVPLNEAIAASRGTAAAYDGITEVWWERLDDLLAAGATAEGQAASQALIADEARFIDFAASRVFFTEEHAIF